MKSAHLVFISSIFFSNIFLQSCAIAHESKTDPVDKLRWVEAADPISDAELEIEKKDYRLLAMATRSISIPGIDPEDKAHLKQKCGFKPIRNTTDVIRNQKQLKYQKKIWLYAKAYNTRMKQACLKR